MKYLIALLIALSFNAEACTYQDGWNCQSPPVQQPIIIPAPITPGIPPVTIDMGGATVVRR
jgi:hypothetical protein